jgi:hypothetical protein
VLRDPENVALAELDVCGLIELGQVLEKTVFRTILRLGSCGLEVDGQQRC